VAHHIKVLYESGHPLAVCTDDKGVFNCSLSSEFLRAKKLLKISDRDIFELSKASIDFAFASEAEKTRLKTAWKKFEEEQFLWKGGKNCENLNFW